MRALRQTYGCKNGMSGITHMPWSEKNNDLPEE